MSGVEGSLIAGEVIAGSRFHEAALEMRRNTPTLQNSPKGAETQVGHVPFLREIRRRGSGDEDRFPFSVPVIRALDCLPLSSPVTFFVGENGSGKSTLLEAIAAAANLPAVGSSDVATDKTLDSQRELAATLRLVWNRRTQRGFFLRAEDFFGFAKRLSVMRAEFLQRIADLEVEYADRSDWAKGLATGPAEEGGRG